MKFRFFFTSCLTVFLLCAIYPAIAGEAKQKTIAVDNSITVETGSGPVTGIKKNDSLYFLGIPYASPPVGKLRWQPPSPAQSWSQPFNANSYGMSCPQRTIPGLGLDLGETSEDCLTINIISPANSKANDKLPIIFMIHGGGFMMGSGEMASIGAAPYLNRAGIIVVSFNYRLGALGFFAHPALESSSGANYGLMDMLAALNWVQDNIAQFGGDPERVTIQGISAGGQAVAMLMVNPEARGLFSSAIAQSSYGGFPGQPRGDAVTPLPSSPAAESVGVGIVSRALASQAGDTPDGNVNREALYAITPDQFTKAITSFHLPIIDGATLPEETTVMFSQGRQHAVPFIGGSTSFDGSVMAASGSSTQFLMEYINDRQAFETLYKNDFAVSEKQAVMRMFGDVRYAFSGWASARFMQNIEQPGYTYRFDYLPPEQRDKLPGAPHGSDGQVFSTPNLPIATIMRGYWINFIKSGNPNGPGLAEWPVANTNTDNTAVMVFDEKARLVPGLGEDKMRFLQQRWAGRTLPLR